jgi:hypothetical protein
MRHRRNIIPWTAREFRPPIDVRGDRDGDHRGHDVLPFPRLASRAIETGGVGKPFGPKAALAGVDLRSCAASNRTHSRKDPSWSAIS